MLGPKKLPRWLREAYIKAVGGCEDCLKKEPEIKLEIHRITQRWRGGTYRPGNIRVLCEKCHKKYSEDW